LVTMNIEKFVKELREFYPESKGFKIDVSEVIRKSRRLPL